MLTPKNAQQWCRTPAPRAAFIALCLSTTMLAPSAVAEVRKSVNTGVTVTYTDNVGLGGRNADGVAEREDAVITTGTLAGNIVGEYNRTDFALGGTVGVSHFTNGTDPDDDDADVQVNQSVLGSGRYEVVRNSVFINADVSSRRVLLSPNSGTSVGRANEDQADAVHSGSITPNFVSRFGDFAVLSGAANYTEIIVQGDGASDTRVNSQTLGIQSGDDFQRTTWRVSAIRSDSTETETIEGQTRDNIEQYSGQARGAYYIVPRKFALTAAGGYDELNTSDGRGETLSGVLWNVGFLWQINQTSSVAAAGGQRYDGLWIEANVEYDITERLRFVATADRTVDTQLLRLIGDSEGITFTEDNILVSQETGAGIQTGGDLQDGLFVRDRVTGSLVGTYGQTTVSVTGSYENRNELEEATDTENTGQVSTLSGGISRRINENTSVGLRTIARHSQIPNTTITTQISNTIDVIYQASRRIQVFGAVTRTDQLDGDVQSHRSLTDPTMFVTERTDYVENAASIGARIQLY